MPAQLHEAPRPLADQLRNLNVPRRRLVKGGGEYLAVHGAPEVRDLLRALIHQQHDDVALRGTGADGLGDLLEHDGLAGARRRDDERALAPPQRGDEVHGAGDDRPGDGILQNDALGGKGGREGVKGLWDDPLGRGHPLDGVHEVQREELLAVPRGADAAGDAVAGLKPVTADQRCGDVDILQRGAEAEARPAQEAMGLRGHVEDAIDGDFRSALRERAQGVRDELIAGTVRVDADGQRLHPLQQLGSGEGMQLIEMDVRGRRLRRDGTRRAAGGGRRGLRSGGRSAAGRKGGGHNQEKR